MLVSRSSYAKMEQGLVDEHRGTFHCFPLQGPSIEHSSSHVRTTKKTKLVPFVIAKLTSQLSIGADFASNGALIAGLIVRIARSPACCVAAQVTVQVSTSATYANSTDTEDVSVMRSAMWALLSCSRTFVITTFFTTTPTSRHQSSSHRKIIL